MGNHSMVARNCFGQAKPGAGQLTVLDIQWRLLVNGAGSYSYQEMFENTVATLGPNWTTVYNNEWLPLSRTSVGP
jgi:hypothetical protein